MVMKKVAKLNRAILFALLLALVLCLLFSVACTDETEEEDAPCVEHEFERIEDALNRAPTYSKEGREIRKCSVCGVTASFVLPKLTRLPTSEDPSYMALLESYVVRYGDSLEKVASMYFTTGWSFVLDKETLVGNVSDLGYDFQVKYTPSEDKYESITTSIKLVVRKAVLTEADVHLNYETDIPSNVNSLEEVSISLSSSQKIGGRVRWVENQEILRNQTAEYEYVFTPEDTNNYEIYYGKVRLRAF